jgi:hypothetical protein
MLISNATNSRRSEPPTTTVCRYSDMTTRSIARSCSPLTHSNPSSAARAFLQLAPRRYPQTTPQPILDFLLPSIPSTSIRNGSAGKLVFSKPQLSRTFTSSSVRQATSVVVNPKKDDDGNDMTVEITPRASDVRFYSKTPATHQYLQNCSA